MYIYIYTYDIKSPLILFLSCGQTYDGHVWLKRVNDLMFVFDSLSYRHLLTEKHNDDGLPKSSVSVF